MEVLWEPTSTTFRAKDVSIVREKYGGKPPLFPVLSISFCDG
jgi:hypothetical protein